MEEPRMGDEFFLKREKKVGGGKRTQEGKWGCELLEFNIVNKKVTDFFKVSCLFY